MAGSSSNPFSSQFYESTMDATVEPHDGRKCPQFVEGSTPHYSVELQSVLRPRLQAAAVALLLITIAFFIYNTVYFSATTATEVWMRVFHVGLIAVLALEAYLLCYHCAACLNSLRMAELVIFGATAAFVAAKGGMNLIVCAEQGYLPNLVGHWFALIYTYAIFIPNRWPRALAVLSLLALVPCAVLFGLGLFHPLVGALITPQYVVELLVMLTFGVASSVVGTNLIGHLREQAFEAQQLGQYRLKRLLGAGGMGQVYLAEHQMLKRPCAVKLIRPGKGNDALALARFAREVQATARLSHWNTIEIYDYGRTDDGTFYYVMEYLPGMSLQELIDEEGPLSPARAVFFLRQACEGLQEAHAQRFIHRDLKPGNLFSAHRGGRYDVLKVLDFGLVKDIDNRQDDAQLTADRSITGSPLFMSPEQALGDRPPDERSDIYSLGATAYFLLTGRPPFQDERILKLLFAHAHEPVIPPTQVRADLPEDLEKVLLKCLAKRPEDRYQSMEELEQALGGCECASGWTFRQAADWWDNRERESAPEPEPAVT